MVFWEVRQRANRSAGALCQWRRCGRRAGIDPQEQSLRAAVVDTLWRVSVTWFARITSWRLAATRNAPRDQRACGPRYASSVAVDADLWSDICSTVLFRDRAAVASWRDRHVCSACLVAKRRGCRMDTGEILAAYAWQKFVVKVSR